MTEYTPGALVTARGREWVVTAAAPPLLTLRPLAGGAETTIHTDIETPKSTTFPPPHHEHDVGHFASARLLSDSVRLKLKDGAGPFRSMGRITFEPRLYQYVPLLMALQHSTVRLLIADDVGIGKTIEAGMIAAELLARTDIDHFTVLCPPHLCDQWQTELQERFDINAQPVTAALAPGLERALPPGATLFGHYRHTIVSLDFIKSDRRRNDFINACPPFVIIDEAHTRIWRTGRHQGYQLLHGLAQDKNRHMIFLTATPHSGDEDSFYNLLTLLDEEFKHIKEATGSKRRQLRERLGHHFVLRTRNDIISGDYDDNVFPEHIEHERAYQANGSAYGKLLAATLDFCREKARQERAQGERMTYWSMLALMRCVASSPGAAHAALTNRIANANTEDESSEELRQHTTDGSDEDGNTSDLPPSLQTLAQAAELEPLIELAKQIADSGEGDPKLTTLQEETKKLIKAGKSPIIFCRYIATANYIAEHLKQTGCAVEAITGEIPSASRIEKVQALGSEKKRILVATDCLSEGINLQDHFDAVIHYDLSWNPTRHQQREGRVDRLGQRSKQVHTLMLYGSDNPVDGAVLEVIIRKANNIRRELGVNVPIPYDNDSITAALLKTVLLHSDEPMQLKLFQDLAEAKIIDAAWETAKKNEGRRSLYAQNRIKTKEILPERDETAEKLGDTATVQRFIRSALTERGITVKTGATDTDLIVEYTPSEYPDLKKWLPQKKNTISFKLPATPRALHLHRAHPMVRHLAELFFQSALLPNPPPEENGQNQTEKLAYRAGAFYSRSVTEPTTIVILRMRHQLYTTKKAIQMVEESAVLRVSGGSKPQMEPEENVLRLLDAPPSKTMPSGRRADEVKKALQTLETLRQDMNIFADGRAQALKAAHERVRRGVERKSNITAIEKAEPVLPPDIIGIYVVLPPIE